MDWRDEKKLKETKAAMRAMLERAESESRDFTAEERAKWNAWKVEAENLERRALVSRDNPFSAAAVMNPNDQKRYSLVRAINKQASGRGLDGLEGEVSQELATRMGRPGEGFYVPLDLAGPERRADGVVIATDLGGALPTNVGSLIELLRARSVSATMGATVLAPSPGTLSLPRQTAGATFAWYAEGTAADASNMATEQVAMTPKRMSGVSGWSKTTLAQSSMDVEAMIRGDLAKGMALALDLGALNGGGAAANAPTGILQHADIDAIQLAAGVTGPLAWADIVAMETAVASSNADYNTLGYVTDTDVRGKLKQTRVDASVNSDFIWRDGGTIPGLSIPAGQGIMNGYRALASTQMPIAEGGLSSLIYGDWSALLIALWGAVDLVIDPYTAAPKGFVQVTAHLWADVAVRHAEAFRIIKGITTTPAAE